MTGPADARSVSHSSFSY